MNNQKSCWVEKIIKLKIHTISRAPLKILRVMDAAYVFEMAWYSDGSSQTLESQLDTNSTEMFHFPAAFSEKLYGQKQSVSSNANL